MQRIYTIYPRVVFLLATLLLAGCPRPPDINAADPANGYPQQLLGVDGDTLFASVVWDVGLPTETDIYSGLFGTNVFQIPTGATAGVHPIALRNNHGTSTTTVDVTVLAPSGTFPAPRIEDIGILSMAGSATPDIVLTVAAANLDTDATVTVGGTVPDTCFRWGGLPVDFLQIHAPNTFNYPVYHYAQILCIVDSVTLGSNLNVMVTNNDGQTDTSIYALPPTRAQLDGDNDGLLDSWETSGYPAPSGATIDLSAMGADKWRKTIFIEVDWIAAAAPQAGVWATIESVFDDAPVLNPNGSSGVDAVIDRGQGGAFTGGGTVLADHTTMDFGPNPAAGYTDFFTYKNGSFANDRLNIFHYAVFGRAMPGGWSGRAEVWGNDFMVTFVNFGVWAQAIAQVGTFVHELGHNIALTHGDLNNTPAQWNEQFKPNFPTTMSYRYQFPGVSIDCDFVSEANHTYSQGMMARINENNVSENNGICDNTALDMNADGNISVGQMDTSLDGDNTDIHDDFDQWGNLLLDFDDAGSRWNSN